MKKCPGTDQIPNALLRRYAEWCSFFLLDIFPKSLQCGAVPANWRCAKVIPIHKQGSKNDVTNFRPISLTSTCYKTLEHILTAHLMKFVEENGILGKNQHGFRKGYSTITILTDVMHEIGQCVDGEGQIDIIFIDYRKAFDKISHRKLLKKLTCLIGDSHLLKWIEAYLSNRQNLMN